MGDIATTALPRVYNYCGSSQLCFSWLVYMCSQCHGARNKDTVRLEVSVYDVLGMEIAAVRVSVCENRQETYFSVQKN